MEHYITVYTVCLCAVVRAVQIVYSHRQKLCREIVKNEYPSNYHCSLFINTFRYHLDFTSYIWIYSMYCQYVENLLNAQFSLESLLSEDWFPEHHGYNYPCVIRGTWQSIDTKQLYRGGMAASLVKGTWQWSGFSGVFVEIGFSWVPYTTFRAVPILASNSRRYS